MSNDDGPRLVVTNTGAERARTWATEAVSWAVRDLAANLLRIVRGAGKPHEVVGQIAGLTQALASYREAFGHGLLPHELSGMLSIDHPEEWRTGLKNSALHRLYAEERIVRGALQVAASRLVEQRTQERVGERELRDGVRDLEDARAEMRREMEAERVSTSTKRPRRPKL